MNDYVKAWQCMRLERALAMGIEDLDGGRQRWDLERRVALRSADQFDAKSA